SWPPSTSWTTTVEPKPAPSAGIATSGTWDQPAATWPRKLTACFSRSVSGSSVRPAPSTPRPAVRSSSIRESRSSASPTSSRNVVAACAVSPPSSIVGPFAMPRSSPMIPPRRKHERLASHPEARRASISLYYTVHDPGNSLRGPPNVAVVLQRPGPGCRWGAAHGGRHQRRRRSAREHRLERLVHRVARVGFQGRARQDQEVRRSAVEECGPIPPGGASLQERNFHLRRAGMRSDVQGAAQPRGPAAGVRYERGLERLRRHQDEHAPDRRAYGVAH